MSKISRRWREKSVTIKFKIDEKDFYKAFKTDIIKKHYEEIECVLSKFLSTHKVVKPNDCIKNLTMNEGMFEMFLSKL